MKKFKAGDLVEVTSVNGCYDNWYEIGEVYEIRRHNVVKEQVFVKSVAGQEYACFNNDFDNSIWIEPKHLTLKASPVNINMTCTLDWQAEPEVIAHMIQQSLAQTALQEALEETEEGFEVGDVVVISESSYFYERCSDWNPTCKGVVTVNNHSPVSDEPFKYRVEWGNGFYNYYRQEDLELFDTYEDSPEVKMIVDLQQIKEASEFCATFNPYVHEDAEFFEQEIFSAIERYEDGKTYTAIYGFYVLFEKEFNDVVFVNVLVDPRLGMSTEYTEATLKDGILVKGF